MDIERRLVWVLPLLITQLSVLHVQPQQIYVSNKQLDCYGTTGNFTKGYLCNAQPSCSSYLTFRSAPPSYTSPITIARLLGGDNPQKTASLIASINNLSSDAVDSIPTDTQVIVPLNCSCYDSQYYQHNATYKLKTTNETYFTVANNTYQGLSTCQALMAQNPYGDRNLSVGLNLRVPLRCACPTSNQTASGVKYLLTYMVTWGDSISSIAKTFGVNLQSVYDANELSSSTIIFPFTPILVPLTTEPTKIQAPPPPPPSAPSPKNPLVTNGDSSNSKKWVYIGIGIGATLLLIVTAILAFLFVRRCKRQHPISTSEPKKQPSESTDYTAIPDSKSWSFSTHGVRHAIESLTVYKFEDLQVATGYFSQSSRIKGSVYRGNFKGDAAAIKVVKEDVSDEISILKTINHSNIIRLSGFCMHEGNTYLVYEYVENGSLQEHLHHHSDAKYEALTWKQRVQIAYDVADGLNYLHNYTSPAYIHKNLKPSNILLDNNMRGKIGNFGLARTILEKEGDGGLQLTRHVVGTQGYMPPEYIENGVITPKLDVFAFGVVLLELLSGKEAAAVAAAAKHEGEDHELLSGLITWVLEGENVREKLRGFVDPCLRDEYPLDLAFSLAQLAKTCVLHDYNSRPPMNQVFITLSKIRSSSLDWDPSEEHQHSSTSLSNSR